MSVLWFHILAGLACNGSSTDFMSDGVSNHRDSSPDTESRPPPTKIMVVIIDTLRADSVGYMGDICAQTPTLDALAEEGVVLEKMIAPRGATFPTIASLLTASYPWHHGVWNQDQLQPNHKTWPDTARDHKVGVFAANGCPVYEALSNTWRYECLDEPLSGQDEGMVRDESLIAAAIEWTQKYQDEATLTLLHLLSPHSPYSQHQPYLDNIKNACPAYTPWDLTAESFQSINGDGLDEQERTWFHHIYRSAVAYDDALLAQLISTLNETNFFDDGLLLIGADHGEALFSVENYTYEEHAFAPWLSVTQTSWVAYAPALLSPQRHTEPKCIVDLGATLFDILNSTPETTHGESFWAELQQGKLSARACYGEVTSDIAYRVDETWQVIANPSQKQFTFGFLGVESPLIIPQWSLFRHDAGSNSNIEVTAAYPEELNKQRELLCDYIGSQDYRDIYNDAEVNSVAEACENL